MTEIKICGIGTLEDALAACECGADALGFVFYKKSPRCVSPDAAREIIRKLPEEVARVGVFVNEDYDTVERIFSHCGLDFIQIHGDESIEYCQRIPLSRLIKAIRPDGWGELPELNALAPRAFLMDSRDPRGYGGTGKRSDWALAAHLARRIPLILAGGLDPENVAAAITEVSPLAVDVGSGVEKAPGRKDHGKIRAFVEAVRAAGGGGENENTRLHREDAKKTQKSVFSTAELRLRQLGKQTYLLRALSALAVWSVNLVLNGLGR